MWTPEYFVRILDFPPTVEGVTIPNDDGTFDIYLSSHLSPRRRQECLEHELRHIFRDHFYSDRPVEELEREADGLEPETPAAEKTATEISVAKKTAPEESPARENGPEAPVPKAAASAKAAAKKTVLKLPASVKPSRENASPKKAAKPGAGPSQGEKSEPRRKRGSEDVINIFSLPDPTLVPVFASIADLLEYTVEMRESIVKRGKQIGV